MRILIDEEQLPWEEAWRITTNTISYTNHTILAEALEKWPIEMFRELLPRIYMIVEEINKKRRSDVKIRSACLFLFLVYDSKTFYFAIKPFFQNPLFF